jgi:riboflavin kinase/FMN adenylyltransferase
MEVLRDFEMEDLPRLVRLRGDDRPAVVTIGNFDGLHQGHRLILDGVLQRSLEIGGQSVLITFDPHPQKVIRPQSAPPLLMTIDQKARLLEVLGFDLLLVIPFSPEMAARTAGQFVDRVLVRSLRSVEVHVGSNFHFGHRKEGSLAFLEEMGRVHGFRAHGVREVEAGGAVVSSSRIRDSLGMGDVELAAELLGYPFHVTGRIVHGAGRGRKLKFPTANLACDGEILPGHGVYLTRFEIQGGTFSGMTNVGVKPTFGDEELSVETYLLDFDGNIYDESARLFFLKRVRDELRFPDVASLVTRIEKDLEVARDFFGLPEPLVITGE